MIFQMFVIIELFQSMAEIFMTNLLLSLSKYTFLKIYFTF